MLEALAITVVLLLSPTSAEKQAATSTQAQDLNGIEPSLYRGYWYTPQLEHIRPCIMKRESHGNYRAQNPNSSAAGAYQFLDTQWREGLVWMMLKETKNTNDGLRAEIQLLRMKPINKWNRYWQDRAFYTAARKGEGLAHWNSPIRCF